MKGIDRLPKNMHLHTQSTLFLKSIFMWLNQNALCFLRADKTICEDGQFTASVPV